MDIKRFLCVVAIGLVAANHLMRVASSSEAEPVVDQTSSTAATPAAAANQAEDVARATNLLAEFRTATSDGKQKSSSQSATQPASTRRSQIEIGRDLMKLGRSAVPLLIRTLDDSDPEVAAVAALALGRIGDSRSVEPLLTVLQSLIPAADPDAESPPSGQLRAQACVCALGQLREPRAVGPIVALQRMWTHRSDLIGKLGFQDHSWDYMCGIMPIVCGDAIERIGVAAAPELVLLLSNANGEIRANAAKHLSCFGVRDDKFRGGWLTGARREKKDESARARNERAARERVVSDRVAKLAGDKLIEVMHDNDVDVRRSAIRAVGNLRIASAVDPLIERLQDEHPWVRSDAIESLGQLGDPAALDALAPLLKNPGPDQSDSAECAVAMIGGPRAFSLLKSGLENAQPKRREAAVHGLLALGTPEAVDLIITALKDPDRTVRFYAAQDLARVRRSEAARAVEPLIAAVRDDPELRREALWTLGHIADARAVDPAIVALKDRDFWVRADALEALGRIKSARAVEPVKAMLKDPHSHVRFHAVYALVELNPPDLAGSLRPMLEDENDAVRKAAANALAKLEKRAPEQDKNR